MRGQRCLFDWLMVLYYIIHLVNKHLTLLNSFLLLLGLKLFFSNRILKFLFKLSHLFLILRIFLKTLVVDNFICIYNLRFVYLTKNGVLSESSDFKLLKALSGDQIRNFIENIVEDLLRHNSLRVYYLLKSLSFLWIVWVDFSDCELTFEISLCLLLPADAICCRASNALRRLIILFCFESFLHFLCSFF